MHDFRPPISSKCFYKPCDKKECKTCPFSNPYHYFIALKPTFNLPILSYSSCNAKNAVYVIYCSFCSSFYVGKTKDIRARISTHRSKIKNFVPFNDSFNSEPTHFNLKFHNFNKDHFSFLIVQKILTMTRTG